MSELGKWSLPGVPHKGWSCIDFDDLGEPSKTCEMCELREIRFVHTMRHPDYPKLLGVGCVCAENMEADYRSARRRESDARSIAGKRSRFMNSPHWRPTSNGNQRINRNGCLIVISKRHSFGYWIKREADDAEWSQWAFKTEDEAKQAAFYKLQDIIIED